MPERKRINARIRGQVFAWLDRNGYSYIPSQSNFFMLDTKRPAKAAIDAMAKQNVFIGRIWPVRPTYARITVGTAPEMEQFQTAWQKVMTGAVTASVGTIPRAGEQADAGGICDGIVIASLRLCCVGSGDGRLARPTWRNWAISLAYQSSVRYTISPCRKNTPLPLRTAEPSVRLSPAESLACKRRHPWVYRSDVTRSERYSSRRLVRVHDQRGKFLGTALYSSSSQIAIRMISHGSVADLPALVAERIRAAIAYRKELVRNTDAYRIVFSEADFLPGLIVDRYNDVLSLQILTQAMDAAPVREAILQTLREELQPAGIVERVDARIRELEQLPPLRPACFGGRRVRPCHHERREMTGDEATASAFTTTASKARRPERSSISGKTTPPRPSTRTAKRSTLSATREDSRCTWPRSVRA